MFRSFALGLLGACFVVIAMRPAVEIRVMPAQACAGRTAPTSGGAVRSLTGSERHLVLQRTQPRALSATVIDAASAATPNDLVALLRLRADERIAAVDDQRSIDSKVAIAEIASAAGAKGRYVDLTIASPRAERRVVLMIH